MLRGSGALFQTRLMDDCCEMDSWSPSGATLIRVLCTSRFGEGVLLPSKHEQLNPEPVKSIAAFGPFPQTVPNLNRPLPFPLEPTTPMGLFRPYVWVSRYGKGQSNLTVLGTPLKDYHCRLPQLRRTRFNCFQKQSSTDETITTKGVQQTT